MNSHSNLTNFKDPLLQLKERSKETSTGFFTAPTFKADNKDNYNEVYRNDIDLLKRFDNYQLPHDPSLIQKKNIVVVDTGQRDWPRQPNAYSFTFAFGEKLGNTKGSILQTPYYYNNPLIPYAAYESTFFNQTSSNTGLIDSAQHVNKYPKIIPGTSIQVKAPDGSIGEVGGKIYGWRRVIDTSGNLKHVLLDGTDTITSSDIVEYYPVYNPKEPRGGFLGIDSSIQVLQNDNNAFSTQVKLSNISSIRLLKATLPLRKINAYKNTIFNTNKSELNSEIETYSVVTVTDISTETVSDLPNIKLLNNFIFDTSKNIISIIRSDRSISDDGIPIQVFPSDPTANTYIYNSYNDVYGITNYLNGVTSIYGLKDTINLFKNECVAQTDWNTISDCIFGICNVTTHVSQLTEYYTNNNTFSDCTVPATVISTLCVNSSQIITQFTNSGNEFCLSLDAKVTELNAAESNYYPILMNSNNLLLTNIFQSNLTVCKGEVPNIPDYNVQNTLYSNITTLSTQLATYKTMITLLSSSAGFTNPSRVPYIDIDNIIASILKLQNIIPRYLTLKPSYSNMNVNTVNFNTSYIPTNKTVIDSINSNNTNIRDITTLINVTNYSSASVISDLSDILTNITKDYNDLSKSSINLNGYPSIIQTQTNKINTSLNIVFNPSLNSEITNLYSTIDAFFNRYSNIDYNNLNQISNTMNDFRLNAFNTYQIGINPSYITSVKNAFTNMGITASNINSYYLSLVYMVNPLIELQKYIIFYTDTYSNTKTNFYNNISYNNVQIYNNYKTIDSNLIKRKINQNNIDVINANINLSCEIDYYSPLKAALSAEYIVNDNYKFNTLFYLNNTTKIWDSVDNSHNTNRFSNTYGVFSISGLLQVNGTLLNGKLQTYITISSEIKFDNLKYYNILHSKNTITETRTVTKSVVSNKVYPTYNYESLDTFNNEPYILMKIDNMKGIYYGPTAGIQNAFAALVQTNKTSRILDTDSLVPQYQDYQPWSQEAFVFDPPLSQLSNAIVTLVDPNDQQFSHLDDLNVIFIEFYPIDSPKFGKMKFYITKYTDESVTNYGSERKMYNYFGTNEIRVGDEIGFYAGNMQQLLNDPVVSQDLRIFFNFLQNQNVMITDVFKINVDSIYPMMEMAYAFDAVIKPYNLSNSYDIFSIMKVIIPQIQKRNILLATTCNILDYNSNTIYPYDNELYSNILVLQQYNVFSNLAITDQSDSSIQYPILYNSDYPFTKKETSTLTRFFEYKHPIPMINKHLQSTFTFEVITMIPDKSELKIIKKK